ncbi:type I-E CRISPR-associated protein Cse2/CasB [Sedimenticola hydrogenitrophicus]|uniref:type I-E CRISPR-associated protein Cse2/CasB n=1 Tax=Sedimenticola hydrogenitrophicus TaxID=2967975 RepID=UPI0021A520AB|nr:type I-E CRISPR-associated protein Cse2/CasB [Sedimenticola hydrogenitrophicus]
MEAVETQKQSSDKYHEWEMRFVNGVVQQCQQDKGLAARLRRADNPATEYQSWELLASYGIDLEREYQRLPFVAIAAAIAKSKAERNGTLSLGRAIAACYEEGRESSQAKARLRRLLACSDLAEVSRILRSLFSLIDSKARQPLDFIRLLGQLHRFSFNDQQVKAQWAQEFYSQPVNENAQEEGT